jgi:hypothetical protein
MSRVSGNADAIGLVKQAVREAFSHKPFRVAVIIMAVAAFIMTVATLDIGGAAQFMQLKFRKTPVPLAKPLETVPGKLGPWVQLSIDQPLDADLEHTLGTKQYIFRKYGDVRVLGQGKIDEILAKADSTDKRERSVAIAEAESRYSRGVINVAVTYYTGMADTVAHVPDRCYIADGYIPTEYEKCNWQIGGNESLGVRFINFEDATGFTSRQSKNVAYCFQVNGAMESDPARVRFSLQNLFKADVYYAKIELMTLLQRRADAAKVMVDFLQNAMPEIRACLPAKSAEQGGATTRPIATAAQ